MTRARGPAFDHFVATHGDALVFFATVVCGGRERGEDATQEALARVYRHFRRIEDPLAYARRAIVNASRDAHRRGVRQERVALALSAEPVASATAGEERLIERELLRTALAQLPERQRAVLLLRFWAGLTEVQTADTLGVSVGTVKQHAARALARLRTDLDAGATPAANESRGDR